MDHFIYRTDNLVFKRVVILPVRNLILFFVGLGPSVWFPVLEIVETQIGSTSPSSIAQDGKTWSIPVLQFSRERTVVSSASVQVRQFELLWIGGFWGIAFLGILFYVFSLLFIGLLGRYLRRLYCDVLHWVDWNQGLLTKIFVIFGLFRLLRSHTLMIDHQLQTTFGRAFGKFSRFLLISLKVNDHFFARSRRTIGFGS